MVVALVLGVLALVGVTVAVLRANQSPLPLRKLRSKDSSVRQAACRDVVEKRDPRVVPRLVRLLLDETASDDLRLSAQEILGKLRDPVVIGPLLESLTRSGNHYFPCYVLRDLADERTLPPLLNMLADTVTSRHGPAAMALGAFPRPDVIAALALSLEDSNLYARRNATQSLGRILRAVFGTQHDVARQTIDALFMALGNSDGAVRYYAAEGLGDADVTTAAEEVAPLVLEDPEGWVRNSARRALQRIAPSHPALQSEEPPMKAFFFRNVLCPLCNSRLPELRSHEGLGGGGDVHCDGCANRVSYSWSIDDARTLFVKMLTLPVDRADPGECTFQV